MKASSTLLEITNNYRRVNNLNNDELRAKIKKLEEQLEDSQLKEEGYRLMIELAEKEFKIPIVKKSDTK